MSLFKKKKSTDDYAEDGNKLFDDGKYNQAIQMWLEGLNTLEKPISDHGEAVWFQTSIADAYFMLEEYEKAYSFLWDAKSNLSGEGYTNPFVMLRLGQCSHEMGKEEAVEYLLRAYTLAGYEVFENEDDKYFELIKKLVR